MIQTSTKDPAEGIVLTLKYTRELIDAETISSVAITVAVATGQDPDPEAILHGAPDLSAAGVVKQEIRGGVDGTTYHIRALATLSSARPLLRECLLPVAKA